MDWSQYPNFSEHEFACSHTGDCHMQPEAMEFFQRIRTRLNRPLKVTSGWRDRSHPKERTKENPGAHNQGLAVDFAISNGMEGFEIIEAALAERSPGMDLGIGVANSFIHIDIGHAYAARPAVWKY